MKKFLQKITMIIVAFALFFAPYEPLIILLAAAEPSHVYLSDIDAAFTSVGYGTFKKNKNESNEMVSLIIDNQRTYSMNALYAHATSTIIYDLRSYTNFDTFQSYVGVDASRGNLGNVKFYIYGSKANSYEANDWHLLRTSNPLKGDSEAEKIVVSVTDYKWLKLVADKNGDNSSDHAVYFDAMLYDSHKYDATKQPTVDWIKTVDEYDKILQSKSDEEIAKNKDLKLQLLQRTLVKRVGYPILQAFVNKNDRNTKFFAWLFKDENNLEEYLLGGTPEGNNYLQALTVFEEVYFKYKDDLKDQTYGKTYKKMMMAISLAYASDVNFWQTANKPVEPVRTPSYPLKRYEVIKKLLTDGYTYDGVSTHFEKEIFTDLEIEEMRWVVNNRISDEEIPWLNWYTQMTLNGKTPYGREGYKNPYNYIYYDGGFRWNYENPEYYKENSNYCSTISSGNLHKSQTDKGYTRGAVCNTKYGLNHFGIETGEKAPLRLWTIWEEDGVCGSLAGTGSNIEMAYGVPSSLVSQPGHAAYFVSSIDEATGARIWGIGNAAAGWARSYKGERMLLDWGSKTYKWVDTNNAAYILIAQRALDEFDKYKEAFIYNLIADVRTDIKAKINAYERALHVQNYNVDSWYGLIQALLQDESTTDNNYYKVAQTIMNDLKEFPLPMYDLLKLFSSNIQNNYVAYETALNTTLDEQAKFTKNDYLQYGAINDIAKYLKGVKGDSTVATFSFDGENAGFLMLTGPAAKEKPWAFEYTLNYEYDAEHKKISEKTEWFQVTDGQTKVDLNDKIDQLNAENDIVIHFLSTPRENIDNFVFIDLTEGSGSETDKIEYNKDEQRFTGIDENVAEWVEIKNFDELYEFYMHMYEPTVAYNYLDWHKFSEEQPPVQKTGEERIFVRNGYTKTYLPSAPRMYELAPVPENQEYSYVPFSRQTVTTSSSLNEDEEKRLVDGDMHTTWTSTKGDKNATVTIKLNNKSILLSKLEYVPGKVSDLGIITKAKIEVSLDGKNWDVVANEISWPKNNNPKSYTLTTPVRAKYVKITALDSSYDYVVATMFKIYENKLTSFKDVNDLHVSYVTNGYTYTGSEIKPSVTVKDGDTELILNDNYYLEYKDNIKAGKGKITLVGLGAYDGEKELEFDIAKAKTPEISIAEGICVDADKETLEEVELPPDWHWKDPSMPLKTGSNEAIAVYDDTENYENVEITITIVKENGHHPEINITEKSFEYTLPVPEESRKTIENFKSLITISDEEDENLSIEDATITSDINWEEAGTYHVTITVTDSDGNTTTEYIQVTINPAGEEKVKLNNEHYEVVIESDNLYYNGQEHNVIVKVRKNLPSAPELPKKENDSVAEIMTLSPLNNNISSHELTENVDYTLDFSELTNAGNHTVTITGTGMYEGKLTATYTINKAIKPTNMIHPEMTVSSDTTRLDQIPLTDKWQWKDADINLKEGENIIKIIFLGDENHERYETEILVIREKDNTEKPTPTNPTPSNPSDSETKPSENTPQVKPTESDKKEDNSSSTSKETTDKNTTNKETTTKPSNSNKETTNEEESKPTEDNKVEESQPTNDEQTNEDKQEQDNEVETNEEQKVLKKEQDTPKKKISNQVIVMAVVAVSFITLGGVAFLLIKIR